MPIVQFDDIALHYSLEGPEDGPALVFSNSLGSDLRIWDNVIAQLPVGLRILRYDSRGHGLSDCPPGPYKMGKLAHDLERLMDHLSISDAAVCGLSIGGMTAQALAVKRLDLVRALVLSNTGAKIGTPQLWQDRIDVVTRDGISALSNTILERWFSKTFLQSDQMPMWRNMLERQPNMGYAATCAAIAGTDLFASTATLKLPTLAIVGSEDGSTPPDMVRELTNLIAGADFHLIRGVGHLPCIEAPEAFAKVLTRFLRQTGHI